jgi:hypothetical protein
VILTIKCQLIINYNHNGLFHFLINNIYIRLGSVFQGLLLHPDNEHLLFPLGSNIIIRHIITRSQTFLRGLHNKWNYFRNIKNLENYFKNPIYLSINPFFIFKRT